MRRTRLLASRNSFSYSYYTLYSSKARAADSIKPRKSLSHKKILPRTFFLPPCTVLLVKRPPIIPYGKKTLISRTLDGPTRPWDGRRREPVRRDFSKLAPWGSLELPITSFRRKSTVNPIKICYNGTSTQHKTQKFDVSFPLFTGADFARLQTRSYIVSQYQKYVTGGYSSTLWGFSHIYSR